MVFFLLIIGILYLSSVLAHKDYTQTDFKEDVAENRIKELEKILEEK